MLSEWWNRFLASDPALRRLRTAARVTLAVAAELLIMVPLLAWWGQPMPMALIGAIVAINSTLGVSDPGNRQQRITTLLMPLPTAFSLVLSTALSPWPIPHILAFLVVIFVATYIRRFGPRYFPLGMVAFLGYFFTMFLQPQLANVPALLAAAVCGALTAYAMRFWVLRDDPEGVLERGRRTLRAQVHGLLHAVRDVAAQPQSSQRRRALHNHSVRLNETALMLENTVQQLDPLDKEGRELVRQRILDVELSAENLLTPLVHLVDQPETDDTDSGGVSYAVDVLLTVLQTEPTEIRTASHQVAEQLEQRHSVRVAMGIRRLGGHLADLAAATGELDAHRSKSARDAEEDDTDDQDVETGLRRPEVRTACQVTAAAGMAIVFGQLVSPDRWYWAVITAFVVFISTRSRGELLIRAWQRTAGTLLGVVAGILVAVRISGHPTAEIAVIMICLFLAFYFAGYSYAALTFFITTMLGALYGMLGTFNAAVLGTRLAETAIGAAAGILAAVVILPTRTRDRVRATTDELLLSLRTFLRTTGSTLSNGEDVTGLRESAREIDDRLQKVVSSARPLTTYWYRSRRSDLRHSVTLLEGCAYYVRNFAVSLPATTEMVDADTRERLAELLWALADGTEALTTEAQREFQPTLREVRSSTNSLHDIADTLPNAPTSLHRSLQWIDRVSQSIEDLARELTVPGAQDDSTQGT